MGESSMGGALVPTVKSEYFQDSAAETAPFDDEPDKDMKCPICMQIIRDACLTACGHSFCHVCISTHLRIKSDCPCCASSLTPASIFPNFLLDKLLKNVLDSRMAKNFELLSRKLNKGCEISIKELDGLLSLLEEKRRKMELQEAENSMDIMLSFLHCLRRQKLQELNELEADLRYIKEDITAVERHRLELCSWEQERSAKLRMLVPGDQHGNGIACSTQYVQDRMSSFNLQNKRADVNGQSSSKLLQLKDAYGRSEMQCVTTPGVLSVARKRRVHSQFNDLQDCYLQKRRNWNRQEEDTNAMDIEGYNPGLEDFQSVLASFTQYSRLRVVAELSHGDLFHSANIVSSIEFDRDEELFATAGVSRCIKVFEFSSVVNEPTDIHCPIVEISSRSKLSCLSWNKYTRNHIASSDYEGVVTVWDVNTCQSMMEYEEHEKRAWSVDFSCTDPSMLVSGSDDCKVKIWCTKQEPSVLNIDMKANICSVKYNPGSSFFVAVGSADHHIHYYDLRNISQPLHVFRGHRKAVSYVKFLSNNELASASTDSTLRLWDVKENLPLCMYRGHMNEKNFVGLAVNNEYIACGSETNELFVYHKAISKPMTWHRFGSSDLGDNDDDPGPHFISAVCWKRDSPMILTANSQGTIKVLVLAA
ncbi:E3 ubiquitin-protein ligase COP1-like isoform X1 [Malus sylvestris]|uniref:E3 ubiquitin-protein ligase COP1-like isoform X1 n=1 Tax=Malus sylvestris TaxID=3752 RepID=UPI0021ABFF03|nr:E3 ubiquitin-protein ligase COP1-like isoform X1 [Malus sylvestris]XP_050105165.1 E3 ubiquitin-protein ligase COP1-like isoform X1 [Malus sylvestris]XP_050105166.1 E3 ubiquitin-protein ligase COP1-like isoform X1 [Malus sylvestris]